MRRHDGEQIRVETVLAAVGKSVLVVVVSVSGVAVAVMHVVNVIIVRHRDMSAPLTVYVVVPVVGDMLGLLALFVMSAVDPVQVAVMHVVNVIAMRDGNVATAVAVHMVMAAVLNVSDESDASDYHLCSLPPQSPCGNILISDHVFDFPGQRHST
jgi:hypothetical protein